MSEDTQEKPKANIYRSKAPRGPATREDCKIKDICGACAYINEPYEPSLQKKWQAGLDQMREVGALEKTHLVPPKSSEKPLGYRNHAKLAVRSAELASNRDADNRFAIGLYKPGTHEIVDIDSCPLHRQTINDLIKDLKLALHQSELQPYDEVAFTGDIRYIAIRSSHLTNEVMLTFVMTGSTQRQLLRGIIGDLKTKGHQIQAAFLNINDENTNVIFGAESKHLTGANRLRENLCEFSFEIGPSSFFQVNPSEAERIYRRIEQLSGHSNSQEVAWDLYCGVGQISLLLARSGFRVLGIEMNPQSIRDAQRNAASELENTSPTFLAGRVENEITSLPAWAQSPRLIITNPSRKGLDAAARNSIAEVMAKNPGCEFMYVSCEMSSLARDAKDFLSKGLKVKQLEAFDMFPYTDKMEWLAIIKS